MFYSLISSISTQNIKTVTLDGDDESAPARSVLFHNQFTLR